MRMAGEVWFPPANQMGEGCAKTPETYPAPVKPAMSHGNPRTTLPLQPSAQKYGLYRTE